MALQSEYPLVATMAIGLTLAFVCGLFASRLRMPPMVGYLFAGILLSPTLPGLHANVEVAAQLSEIGVLLLMFGVGLHFSLKDLLEVKRIALPGALIQMAGATALGFAAAHYWWGWQVAGSLIFGFALSVASTAVLIRALEDTNFLLTNHGRVAVGWLVVEDIVMILALAFVPALVDAGNAPSAHLGAELLAAISKIAMFILFMIVAGRRILPWVLKVVAQTRSRELFTLAVISASLGVAFLSAELFEVSLALGAFFAGMMIRESDLNHEAMERAIPLQDAFAVLFFVSVGMLLNPYALLHDPLKLLATVAIIMLGKSAIAYMIIRVLGYPLKTALIVSAGLAQIGEFSFILIGLAVTQGLVPADARTLIVAAAIISMAFNPPMFLLSYFLYKRVKKRAQLSDTFNTLDGDLSTLPPEERNKLRRPVILVGHGNVGRHISRYINDAHMDLVIIESNRDRAEFLRDKGFHAIAGDASHRHTLIAAGIEDAVAVAIAVPDPFQVRKIAAQAREINPHVKILARAHNDEEMDYFLRQHLDLAITGPSAIGKRMADYIFRMTNHPR